MSTHNEAQGTVKKQPVLKLKDMPKSVRTLLLREQGKLKEGGRMVSLETTVYILLGRLDKEEIKP